MGKYKRVRFKATVCFLAIVAFALATTACMADANSQKEKGEPAVLNLVVTVNEINKTKGVYALVTKEGKHYEPVNLPVTYRYQGTQLRVKGEVLFDRATTNNIGPMLKIDEFELLHRPDVTLSDGNYD